MVMNYCTSHRPTELGELRLTEIGQMALPF